ncbi:helix-turn-helix domain-containing protein [Lacticaseibacillus absianus]|uniref:helix-turn-helix domain-containing protein n=1 Tax=Lacticaseibacillus absianus TaxID=2729623 RepID=UPI0015C85E9D|nr:helix-turn-helix domain-containing protein [Lacticaseibacillus absianus]
MSFEACFLDKASLLKFNLYALLAAPADHPWTVRLLAEALDIKYQTATRMFNELIGELSTLTDAPKTQLRLDLLKAHRLPLTLDQYRAETIRAGLTYELIHYIVTTRHPTIEQFSSEHFVSTSTATRRMKQVAPLMAQFGINFRLTPLALIGDELRIRFFLYTMYWETLHGSFWPFTTTPKSHRGRIATVDHYTPSDLFNEISDWRVGSRHALAPNRRLEVFGLKAARLGFQKPAPQRSQQFREASARTFFRLTRLQLAPEHYTYRDFITIQMVLARPWSYLITDPIRQWCLVSGRIEWNDELDLNLFRVIIGVAILESPMVADALVFHAPQPSAEAVQALLDLIDGLPSTTDFALFHRMREPFATLLAQCLEIAADTAFPFMSGSLSQA